MGQLMAKKLSQPIFAINTFTFKCNSCMIGSCKTFPCTIGRVVNKTYLTFSFQFIKRRLPFNCDGGGGR
uniref:Uncharacterized protein n=1 Tax=Manihot esculenta TaxID=3983 RepID=A0A2C9VDM1_MANES